jgi:hypothetical protein
MPTTYPTRVSQEQQVMVHPTSSSASYVSRPIGAAHVRLLTRLSQRYALGSSSTLGARRLAAQAVD